MCVRDSGGGGILSARDTPVTKHTTKIHTTLDHTLTSSQALIFIRTYVAESVRFPTSTTASPGVTPVFSLSASTSALISPRIASAMALPVCVFLEGGSVGGGWCWWMGFGCRFDSSGRTRRLPPSSIPSAYC